MDIDMNVLRGLESEKDISMDLVIKAIEDALLVAYQRTEGAAPVARVGLDRQTGHVMVWAAETGLVDILADDLDAELADLLDALRAADMPTLLAIRETIRQVR